MSDAPGSASILRHLPPHASSLDVGAFAECGPGPVGLFDSDLDSVTDSPLHGSCLTPSQLYTPTASPQIQIRKSSNIGHDRDLIFKSDDYFIGLYGQFERVQQLEGDQSGLYWNYLIPHVRRLSVAGDNNGSIPFSPLLGNHN